MLRKNTLLITVLISVSTIWLIAPTSGPWSPAAPITSNLTNDDQPSLSGSGNRIAFISDLTSGPELFSMKPDGTELKQLTSNQARECCPSITRDGTTIVFQSDLRGDEEIFLINADGTIPQSCVPNRIVQGTGCQLTDNREDDVTPVISPDGSKIAFASNRDGDLEIFNMNPDGGGVTQLTFNGASDENPSISGNGGLVAFDSNLGGDYEIFIITTDGTGLTQLTINSDIQDKFPSISEDGGKIVFEAAGPAIAIAHGPSPNMGGPTERSTVVETSLIMIVNSDGTGLKALTTNSADNRDASISGDGRLVAFVSNLDGDKEIFTIHPDGTMMVQVTMNNAIDFSPRLNYTGEILVYVSNLDGDFEIFIATSTETGNHDVAVTMIEVPRRIGYNQIQSNPLAVRVTLQNQGTVVETVTAQLAFLNGSLVGSQTATVPAEASQTLTFNLDPRPFATGSYSLVATALPIPGETDTQDNSLSGGTVQVRAPGDVTGDGSVNIFDATTLGHAYRTQCGETSYQQGSDFNNDCQVDIVDAAVLGAFYGT